MDTSIKLLTAKNILKPLNQLKLKKEEIDQDSEEEEEAVEEEEAAEEEEGLSDGNLNSC